MTARSGYITAVRGWESAYYQGANGQMAGSGDIFNAGALFSLFDDPGGGPAVEAVWGNIDVPNFRGWAIEIQHAGSDTPRRLRARIGTGAAFVTLGPVTVPTGWLLYPALLVVSSQAVLFLNGTQVAVANLPAPCQPSALAPMVGREQSDAPVYEARSCQLHGVAYRSPPSGIGKRGIMELFYAATSANDLAAAQFPSTIDFTNRFSARFGAVVPGAQELEPPAATVWTPLAGSISLTQQGQVGALRTLGITRMEWATPIPGP